MFSAHSGSRTASDPTRVEQDFFDRLVGDRGEFNPFQDRGWEVLRRRLLRSVPEHGRRRVLDVGCGTGESRRLYRPTATLYAALDLALAPLALAVARFPSDRWLQAQAEALPWAPESFDLVAFSSVLHHLPRRGPALAEAMRVLRPGGFVFAFDPNLLHPPMALFRHPRSPFYSRQGVSPMERPLLASSLRRDLEAAGFVEVVQRAQSSISYRAVAPRWLDAGLWIYNLCDRLLAASRIDRWLGSFVISAARKPPPGRRGARKEAG